MTEEEYFRKHYPDVCYNGKPLSPYWDLFQDGVEFSERQSEKKIEELEQKLEQTEKDLADYQFNYPTIKELTEGTCFAHLKSLEKENAELKEKLKNWKDEWQEQVQKAIDEGYARTQQTIQLTNAKEIIKEFVAWANWEGVNCPKFQDIQSKAEQFIKEIEK